MNETSPEGVNIHQPHFGQHIAIAALLVVFSTVGSAFAGDSPSKGAKHPAIVLSEKCSEIEKRLESVRALSGGRDATSRTLAQVMTSAKETPSEVSVPVAEAVCSGLLAIGENAAYAKARGMLRNSDSFAEPVLVECPKCHGEREEKKECEDCHGSGECGNASCEGGRTYLPMVGNVACPRCGGSGKCKTCNATGVRKWPCQRCNKAGRVVDPNAALRMFSGKLEKALSACRCHEVVPVTGISGSGPTIAKATSDALVNAAQKVLGPDGASMQKLLAAGDKTIVKGFKVVDKGEDESGLFTVKANVLVVRELESESSK